MAHLAPRRRDPRSALVVPLVALPRDLGGFSYTVPEAIAGRIEPGARVRIPFRNRTVTGVVWTLDPPADPPPTRSILGLLSGCVPGGQRAFVDALARAHLTSVGAFPGALRKDAAGSRPAAAAYFAYLAEPERDAARLTELAGERTALVVTAGSTGVLLPEAGARWVRGADAAVLDPSKERSPIIVYREEAPEHRRRVPPFLDTRRTALLRSTHLGTPTVFTARAPRAETIAALDAGSVRALGAPPPLPHQSLGHVPAWTDPVALGAITAAVADGGSAFIWLPATGYAGSLGCRRCGWTHRCSQCHVALTVPDAGHVQCRSCAETAVLPTRCERCGSTELTPRASGTAGVTALLARTVPGVPVVLLTARQPLPPPAFRGILVGTHAFLDALPRYFVRAAVVAGVERFLAVPDFRAEERFAQNLTALRWALPGGSRLLLAAHDAEGAEQWMVDPRERVRALLPDRTEYLYPPTVRLVLLSGRGLPEAPERLPGIRRADPLPGTPRQLLLRVEPAAWDALVPILRQLPRTVTVEPDPDRGTG